METPAVTAAVQVLLGGALVFATGVLIGSSQPGILTFPDVEIPHNGDRRAFHGVPPQE